MEEDRLDSCRSDDKIFVLEMRKIGIQIFLISRTEIFRAAPVRYCAAQDIDNIDCRLLLSQEISVQW